MGRHYLDELRTILRSGRHPDGRLLGSALAERLDAMFGRPVPVEGGA